MLLATSALALITHDEWVITQYCHVGIYQIKDKKYFLALLVSLKGQDQIATMLRNFDPKHFFLQMCFSKQIQHVLPFITHIMWSISGFIRNFNFCIEINMSMTYYITMVFTLMISLRSNAYKRHTCRFFVGAAPGAVWFQFNPLDTAKVRMYIA